MVRILERLRSKHSEPWEKVPPVPREDADTFVMHGDILWGNSIMHMGEIDEHTFRVTGWTTPKPRPGDILVAKCASGQWGQFVLREIEHAQGVHDMWFGVAVGVIGYVDEPRTKRATEYVERGDFV